MKNLKLKLLGALLASACLPATANAVPLKEIFGLGPGDGNIYRIDLTGPTVTNLGYGGVSFPTNLAMSPDRTLYYMNPFDSGGHALYKATLNATNTALVGAPTLVKNLPTSGFGIIDGMTVGPDGNLYMTGYGKSEIYQYDVTNDVFSTTVHLVPPASGGPAGEFRSDLAFDPITGNLIGLGIEPGSTDRTLFEIPFALALTAADDAYVWDYFGSAGSAWETKKLDTGTELGDNPDGIAFDPTNGDLYMSGDGTGVYAYGRTSAVRGALIAGTETCGPFCGVGYDLAFQTLEVPIGQTPEPGTLWLALLGMAGMAASLRRRLA